MFKKFFILISLSILSLQVFAAKFPSWSTKDQAVLDNAIIEFQKENMLDRVVVLKLLKEYNTGSIKTFDQFLVRVDELGKELNPSYILLIKKQIPLCTNTNIRSAFEFCKNNPSDYDINYYIYFSSDKLGISKDEHIIALFNYLNTQSDIYKIKIALKNLLELLPDYDQFKSKDMLQKLNRRYSPRLTEDKDNWEPIVAKIRTALEVY